jgi:lipopolysaccharide export system permease protein
VIQVIDRYIARMFIGFFFSGLIVFVTLFVAIDFMTNTVRLNAPLEQMAHYYLLYLPWIVQQMTAVACLLGTVFTLSSMSKNNELVALFSSGLSLSRVVLPILILVVMISGFSFWLGDRILPIANQKKNYLYYVEIRKQPGLYSTVKTNKIWYRSNNVLFNIRALQAKDSTAQGLTMYYFDNSWKLIQLISAKDVKINGKNWELHSGAVTLFTNDESGDSSIPMAQNFKKKTITMDQDAADLQASQTTDTLTIHQLSRFIERNKEAGVDTLKYEVDYHSKFSFAFASFVMAFIGIPFSVSRQRSGGTATNAGVCVLLAFVYWLFYSSGLTLGNYGYLPPTLAAWIPNITMLIFSAFLVLRLKR